MADVKSINFPEKLVYGPLSFLRAEWWDMRSRFVLVRYSVKGEEQGLGLRLDMDKKIFLDHLSDPNLDKFAQAVVKPIWEYIVHARWQNSDRPIPWDLPRR